MRPSLVLVDSVEVFNLHGLEQDLGVARCRAGPGAARSGGIHLAGQSDAAAQKMVAAPRANVPASFMVSPGLHPLRRRCVPAKAGLAGPFGGADALRLRDCHTRAGYPSQGPGGSDPRGSDSRHTTVVVLVDPVKGFKARHGLEQDQVPALLQQRARTGPHASDAEHTVARHGDARGASELATLRARVLASFMVSPLTHGQAPVSQVACPPRTFKADEKGEICRCRAEILSC